MERLCSLFFFIMFPVATYAVCGAGYYLENGECKLCNPGNEPFYCPGDDIRYACPSTDTDYEKLSGWKYLNGLEVAWAGKGTASPNFCYSGFRFRDSYGNQVLIECPFNGENYWCDRRLWYVAANGFYMADYSFTSSYDWYSTLRKCSNAPENAQYTGPGTPDAPDGSVIDANDCPWECQDGYGNHNGECVPLCDVGVRTMNTSDGIKFNLYPVRYSTPAIVIKYSDIKCYGVLTPGAAKNSINIQMNDGTQYHVIN